MAEEDRQKGLKAIWLDEATHSELMTRGKKGDTFNDIVKKLLEQANEGIL